MIVGEEQGQPVRTMTRPEREAHWTLWVRFAIEAVGEDEARAIAGQALASLETELPLRGAPKFQSLGLRDDIWVATA
ncbi:MAG TPA: hypothetical protein VHU92_10160 [Streptosporangiaceae bacterium]|nr:hypothetical protein [Streptosporangiaceae bacterium]